MLGLSFCLIVAFVALLVFLLMHMDHAEHARESRNPSAVTSPPLGSFILISVSAWTIGFLAISGLRIIPGSFGPVQFAAGQSLAMFVFHLRFVTILTMLAVPVVCSLLGVIRAIAGRHICPDWLAAAVGAYLIAWILLYFNLWFIPMV